jgi:FixJ family two-component response regulator
LSKTPNICVAVVDDDEGVCKSLRRLLRAADLQPFSYSSAEAFLADPKHPCFDCLVLDIQLPGISGLELTERLAARGNHAPIIFHTGHDEPELRRQAEALHCAGYFQKTNSGSDLLTAIRRAVNSGDERGLLDD